MSTTLPTALRTPDLHRATPADPAAQAAPALLTRRHATALGAALSLATALLLAWPLADQEALPMTPLLAAPVTGHALDWTLDFLRQSDTQHRLGRDGRIWVPQDRADHLRRQAQALGLLPGQTDQLHGGQGSERLPAIGRNGVN